ncbi:hypothetical protein JXA80_10500, partial [bacterium]|nr:hypothetical protein [candidate division CSSED10-310 bacterium]
RYGGLNNTMITGMIRQREFGAILLEPDSFAVGFPGFYAVDEAIQESLFDAVRAKYREAARLRSLGNGEMTLRMYLPVASEDGV